MAFADFPSKVQLLPRNQEVQVMPEAERINPREAREHMNRGSMLVCAYDSDDKFRSNHLAGAMSLNEFTNATISGSAVRRIF